MKQLLLCAFVPLWLCASLLGCQQITPLDRAAQDEAQARQKFDNYLRDVAAAAHAAARDTAGLVPELPSALGAAQLSGAVSEAVGRPERPTPWAELTPDDLLELQAARDELKSAAANLLTERAAAQADTAAVATEIDKLRAENKNLKGQVGWLVSVVKWIWRGLFAVPVGLLGLAAYQLLIRRAWNPKGGLLMGLAYVGLALVSGFLWWQYGQLVIVAGMCLLLAAALIVLVLMCAKWGGFETLVAKVQAWRDQVDPQIRTSFDLFMDGANGQSSWLKSMILKAKLALGLKSAG